MWINTNCFYSIGASPSRRGGFTASYTLVESLNDRVIGYRNEGIIHGNTTNVYRSFSGTGSDDVSARIGVQRPGTPAGAPPPIDSGVPGWLSVEINEYFTAWFIYIDENAAKCCVPLGHW